MSLQAGTMLGHYQVLSAIGAGGMGEVYRARDKTLGREVAIKVLPEELSRDPERLSRFEREAKLLASLNHPAIATLHGLETFRETPFLVMELVDGRTLDDVMAEGRLAIDAFLSSALPIAEAVAEAHRGGVTHRDLKPGNVMVSASGRIKVLDFGLAKDVIPSSTPEAPTAALVTRQGVVLGTVPYMSPEQLQGKPVEPASDVFSLGVMFYEMATGQRPFQGSSQIELASSILRDRPRAASDLVEGLPLGLDRVLERCLEKDPAQRYSSAIELREAIFELREQVGGRGTEPAGIPTPVSATKRYRTAMVGRESEVAQLCETLELALRGAGSVVTVAGEPGVGKSRLSMEIMKTARSQGFLALVGSCYEAEGARPFGPWVEILDDSARLAPKETLRKLLGEGAPEIAKLHPGLRRLYPDLPPPLEMPPEAERAYLFDCFREFVERSCRLQPMMLVLEDLHWADDPTLLLLQHISQRAGAMALVIVGTYRDAELDTARSLAKVLRELVRARLLRRIALGRLPESGVADMLKGLSGQEPPVSLLAAINGETEGNPFFVEEVYEHLAEEGRLFDEKGLWRRDLTLEELDVPEGVRLVVGRRLERLDEHGQRLLTAAAVIGRRFSYPLLETVAEVGPDLMLDEIEEAEKLHLIEAAGTSSVREVRYQFTHELIRQTLLLTLSVPRRQRLHLRVAEAMEHRYGDTVGDYASALAHHLYQAGTAADQAKTLRYLLYAADQALETGGFEQVVANLELAFPMVPQDEPRMRANLLWKRGLARRSLGNWDRAISDWEEALPWCEASGDRRTIATIASDLSFFYGWAKADPEAMVDVSSRGLSLVGDEPNADRCRLLSTVGMSLGFARKFEAGDRLLGEAVEAAEALGDPDLLGYIWIMKRYQSLHSMRSSEMVSSLESAIEVLRPSGDLWSLVDAQCSLSMAYLNTGRLESSSSFLEQAERLGHFGARFMWMSAATPSVWMQTADFDRFEELAGQARELAIGAEMPWWTLAQGWQALAAFWRGDWQAARELALEAAQHEPDGALYGIGFSHLFLIDSYLGRSESALEVLASKDLLPRGAGPHSVGSWAMLHRAVEGLAVLGERERAASLHPLLLGAIDTGTVVEAWTLQLCQKAAGISAAAGGQWEVAQEHFEKALQEACDIPYQSEQAEVRRWYASMLLDRRGEGDVDYARELLEKAVVVYQKIGMTRHCDLANSLIQDT